MLTFLCDEMLAGLGRWLRVAGYDTEIATGGRSDRDLLAQACAEGRWLLTRDRGLLQHRGAPGIVIVLESNGLTQWARELGRRLDVNWLHRPFSRCTVCNTVLIAAESRHRAHAPPHVKPEAPLHHCPRCRRLYWQGGHVRRMRRQLEDMAAAQEPSEFRNNGGAGRTGSSTDPGTDGPP